MTTKEKFKFKAILLVADAPTAFGRIYSRELCEKLVERLTKRPYIVVQEFNQVERKLKNVRVDEVWKQKIMASIKSAEMVGDNLVFEAECRLSRDGKKLSGMVQTLGIEDIQFVPVGRGIPDDKGVIGDNYEIIYVAVEPNDK